MVQEEFQDSFAGTSKAAVQVPQMIGLKTINEYLMYKVRKLVPNGNLLLDDYKCSYEVINEAKGFCDGFKKNGLSFSRSNEKNTLYVCEGVDWSVPDKDKGGIIVFSTDVNAMMDDNKYIISWGQKIASVMNCFKATSEIDNVANNLVGWTIGHHLDGRYKAKNGKNYGENSLSVEVIGVSLDTLIKIAEELCRAFLQESVVCKSWSNGDVLFINRNL